MSRLDDLERELFRAASGEEPSPKLRQLVHERLGEFSANAGRKAARDQPRRAVWRRLGSPLVMAGFGGAVAIAAVALLLLRDPREEQRAATLEAERLPATSAPVEPRRAAPPVADPEPIASATTLPPDQRAVPTPRPLAEQRAAPPRSLAEQLELLGQARSAMRAGNGARVLALLDEYAARKNSVDMNAEAMLLRVEALQALGRRNQARTLAAEFVTSYPDNPLADRARALQRAPLADTEMGREKNRDNQSNETKNDE